MAQAEDLLIKSLKGLEARTLEELLFRLADLDKLRAKGVPVRQPTVTLHLRNGQELHGLFLEQREDPRSGKTVILQALSSPHQAPAAHAHFVRLESIDAITVHELPSLTQPPAGGPPPPASSS